MFCRKAYAKTLPWRADPNRMTRRPFVYDPKPQSRRARGWLLALALTVAVAYAFMVYWVDLRNGLPQTTSDWVTLGLHLALLALFGAQLAWPRRFSLSPYIKIDMGSIEYCALDPEALWPKRTRISLSNIEQISVALLTIEFTLRDGKRETLPLGHLPYEVVQQIKARFTGIDSLREVSGGALARRALASQN